MLDTSRVEEQLIKARAEADRVGLREQFEDRLKYLAGFSHPNTTKCVLYPDFAPFSFEFVLHKLRGGAWDTWFNGGLIYHGPHDNGGDGGGPTYSVNLEPCHGWQVHT